MLDENKYICNSLGLGPKEKEIGPRLNIINSVQCADVAIDHGMEENIDIYKETMKKILHSWSDLYTVRCTIKRMPNG